LLPEAILTPMQDSLYYVSFNCWNGT